MISVAHSLLVRGNQHTTRRANDCVSVLVSGCQCCGGVSEGSPREEWGVSGAWEDEYREKGALA